MDDAKMSFTAHLEELRRRLVTCLIAVGIGFIGSYFFKEDLFQILVRPLLRAMGEKGTLIFTGVPEPFFVYLKVSLVAGIFFTAPVILFEVWAFIAPGLYSHEKKYVVPFVFFSSILFVLGTLFGYYIVCPYGFKFLLGFAGYNIEPMLAIKEYFSFSTKLLLAFGFVFELPLFIVFLSKAGIVSPQTLSRQRKYAILLIFVVAAILTPPDVATQIMMAGPLIGLFEIGIIMAKIFRKKEEMAEDEKAEG
ncbi:MAG: twin-arginine translocase subunit TatC [Proteobacteria bacterium]|nr:twin-arginine translocase subunit TatC [Pseudomonadota bacterium]